VRCLSFHSTYGCRERGACCTAGWPIPVEDDRAEAIEASLRSGHLTTPTLTSRPLLSEPDGHWPATVIHLLATNEGHCVFHRATGDGRCAIHRSLGHRALPLACRQFPRVTVTDPRGISVTLSHYCPTALDHLGATTGAHIVENAVAFPADGEYVGLDATGLPPVLRPGMFMDWDAWWEWEALGIREIARSESVDDALAILRAAVEDTRTWSPGDGALIDRVRDAFDSARRRPLHRQARSVASVLDAAMAAVPAALRPDPLLPGAAGNAQTSMHVRRNFVLAHAFANWTAHLGEGLRSWLASVEASDVLCVDAGLGPARTDLLLRHLAHAEHLADAWSLAERAAP
jgi:Fe-S-cluster containining protein